MEVGSARDRGVAAALNGFPVVLGRSHFIVTGTEEGRGILCQIPMEKNKELK